MRFHPSLVLHLLLGERTFTITPGIRAAFITMNAWTTAN